MTRVPNRGGMDPDLAAARIAMALRPKLALNALAAYSQFAREVHDEAGPVVLADIVREVERHAAITRPAA